MAVMQELDQVTKCYEDTMLVARGLLPWRPGRRSRVCARARVCAWVHAHTCAHSRRKSHFNWIDGERRNNNSYV